MVYLIACDKTRVCKIGHTKNIESRLTTLQTGHAYPLRLVFSLEGGHDLERWLHFKFKHLRLKGEWFRFEHHLQLSFAAEDLRLRGCSELASDVDLIASIVKDGSYSNLDKINFLNSINDALDEAERLLAFELECENYSLGCA
jgi:Meiotically up-regulated gene 113